jgi:hypothetical protein
MTWQRGKVKVPVKAVDITHRRGFEYSLNSTLIAMYSTISRLSCAKKKYREFK